MKRHIRSGMTAALAVALCLVLAGCSTSFEYVPDGGEYTLAQTQELAQDTPLGKAAEIRTADANAERVERLTELRGHGEVADALADALTSDFPPEHAAVPLLVEAATVDGKPAWVIVEAWGEEDGNLSHKRLWVLDRATYAVVASSSFR